VSARHVVVGGGIVGLSVALAIARRGEDVLVLDAGRPASSLRSAAVVRTIAADPTLALLAQLSLSSFERWGGQVSGASPFEQCGVLVVLPDDLRSVRMSAIDAATASAEALTASGYVPPQDGIVYHDRRGGLIDPVRALDALRQRIETHGGRLATGLVTGIESRNGDVTGVATSAGSIPAEIVIVAAGAWTAQILGDLWPASPFNLQRAEVATFASEGPRPQLPLLDLCRGVLVRRWHHNELLTSVRETAPISIPDQADPRCDIGQIRTRIEAVLQSPLGRVTNRWAAVYDTAPDDRPYVGAIRPHLYVAAGFGGSGFKLAPAIGLFLADMVAEVEPAFDLSAFAPTRRATAPRVRDFGLREHETVGVSA